MQRWIRKHPVVCFVLVTYGVTWGLWIPLAVSGRGVTVGFVPAYMAGLLGPLTGALVTTAVLGGRRELRALLARMVRIRVAPRWWAIALGLPIAIAIATYGAMVAYSMFLLAPTALPSASALAQFNGFPVTSLLGTWALLVVVNGLGEETGWRGFLLPQLMQRWSALGASLAVGALWALWHVPAFWISESYRQMPPAMIPMFAIGLVSGAVFLAWLHNRGGRSILLVAVWHGTFNLLSGSVGARGALAAVESTAVIAIAAALVLQELRARRREHTGRPAHHVMASGPVPADGQ